MICGTCGTDKMDNGKIYCVNGHDDWIEWSDFLFPKAYNVVERAMDTLNLSLPEFVLKIYSSYTNVTEPEAIIYVFRNDFFRK